MGSEPYNDNAAALVALSPPRRHWQVITNEMLRPVSLDSESYEFYMHQLLLCLSILAFEIGCCREVKITYSRLLENRARLRLYSEFITRAMVPGRSRGRAA
jgi:hypothetical protein